MRFLNEAFAKRQNNFNSKMTCQNDNEAANKIKQECLLTLKTYKNLSELPENHEDLLKEKTPLLYPATLLEEKDATIVNLSLDVLENFISNDENHSIILSTFGVFEALESLALRKRKKDNSLSTRAEELADLLRSSAPPAFGTRSRSRAQDLKKNSVFLLEIEKLNKTNKRNLDRVLVRTKGVISFLIDLERKRCTIRLCQNTSIHSVAKRISEKCNMTPMVVTKDLKSREEVLKNVLDCKVEKSLLEYYEDIETPPRNTAITKTMNFVKTGNCLLKSVTGFLNDSFYW